jgi:hypothetical protein
MKKHHKISLSLLATFLVIAGLFQFYSIRPKQQIGAASNTANFSVEPNGGGLAAGSTVGFSIYVSLDNSYNAATADFYYNNARFQYVGVDYGASFPQGRSSNQGSNGYGSYIAVTGSRSGSNLSGRKLLATVKFKMRSAGAAYGNFGKTTTTLYPTKAYGTAAQNGTYTLVNPAPPPTPPKPPTAPPPSTTPPTAPPPVTPAPSAPSTPPQTSSPSTGGSVSTAPKKTTTSKARSPSKNSRQTSIVPTTSKPSATGLTITDLVIGDKDYRSAVLTWKTTVPSSSKINYGTNKEDLYLEQKDDKKATEHRIQLNKENLKAGSRYYIRVTSNDDKGPVTIDGDFYTKFIPVIIKVTNEAQKPLADVDVASGEASGVTNENGEALLELPEGDVVIYAEKDDLNRELSATIDLPSGDDLQRITLSMTTDSNAVAASTSSAKTKISILKIVGIIALLLIGGFGLFVLFMRRKNGKQYDTDNSVEIDSSPQHVLPDTPPAPLPPASHQPTTLKRAAPQPIQTQDPVYTPVQNQTVQRYTSLPELVGRYGTQEAASSTPSQKPTPTLTQAPHQNMNVAQQPLQQTVQTIAPQLPQMPPHPAQQHPAQIQHAQQPIMQHLQQPPRHVSLKELVHNEPTSRPSMTDPVNDLPVAPDSAFEEGHFDRPRNNQSADGSLSIHHEE